MLKERIEETNKYLDKWVRSISHNTQDHHLLLNQLAIMESLERMELLLEMTCSIAKNHEHKEQP